MPGQVLLLTVFIAQPDEFLRHGRGERGGHPLHLIEDGRSGVACESQNLAGHAYLIDIMIVVFVRNRF